MKHNPRKYTVADVLWDRDNWRHYYDGLEATSDRRFEDAGRAFREAMNLNPHFPSAYKGLAIVAKERGKEAEGRKLINLAFEKVLAAYPKWPRRLSWADIENRPTLRVIQLQAMLQHEDGDESPQPRLQPQPSRCGVGERSRNFVASFVLTAHQTRGPGPESNRSSPHCQKGIIAAGQHAVQAAETADRCVVVQNRLRP